MTKQEKKQPPTKQEKKRPATKGEDVKRTASNTPPPPPPVTKQEKNQPIEITIPIMSNGARSFIRDYLTLKPATKGEDVKRTASNAPPPLPPVTNYEKKQPSTKGEDVKRTASNILPSSQASVPLPPKRRRNDQHDMETPSLPFTEVKVNPPSGCWGIGLKQAKHVITIQSIDAKCVMKGQLKAGDQLTGVDGNISFSTIKEVTDLKQLHPIRTLTFKRLEHVRPSDVIDITSSSDDESTDVIVIASSSDDESTDIQ